MNVKQPLAWALVNGYKDCENKVLCMCSKKIDSLPFWVLICANKTPPTKTIFLDFCKTMTHTHNKVTIPAIKQFQPQAKNGLGLGGVIGAVRFDSTGKSSTCKSKWCIKNGKYKHVHTVGKSCCFCDSPPVPIIGFQGDFQNISGKSFENKIKNYIRGHGFQVVAPEVIY